MTSIPSTVRIPNPDGDPLSVMDCILFGLFSPIALLVAAIFLRDEVTISESEHTQEDGAAFCPDCKDVHGQWECARQLSGYCAGWCGRRRLLTPHGACGSCGSQAVDAITRARTDDELELEATA